MPRGPASRAPGRPARARATAARRRDTAGTAPARCDWACWRGARGGRDVAVAQLESVVPAPRDRQVREAEPVQRLVQPVAAGIPREHPAGAVRPVRRGRQAHDQQSRARVTKRGDGPAPIVPVAELALLVAGDAATVGTQPGTALAR